MLWIWVILYQMLYIPVIKVYVFVYPFMCCNSTHIYSSNCLISFVSLVDGTWHM
jgi:hypothetical protein